MTADTVIFGLDEITTHNRTTNENKNLAIKRKINPFYAFCTIFGARQNEIH